MELFDLELELEGSLLEPECPVVEWEWKLGDLE
jgi:hypothetical protein